MFVVRKEGQPIRWPVTIPVPVDGGASKDEKFMAHFLVIGQEEYKDIAKEGDKALLARVLVGWDEEAIKDADGNPLPFTPELRDWMADQHHIRTALVAAYWQVLSGRKEKNS
jgi:hypothetical protein